MDDESNGKSRIKQNMPFATALRAFSQPLGLLCALSAGVVIFCIRAFFLIRHSLLNGSLSAPLTNDDVEYLGDALRRMENLRSGGLWSTIQDFFANPPHSPMSTLIGAISFALSGSASFAPYLANGILLGVLLGLFAHRLRAPLAISIGILAGVSLLPLTDWAIMNFRPDIMAGIFTACVCGILVVSDINCMTAKAAALLGIAGGICLLYKPSAFPPTGALLATAFALAVVKARRSPETDPSRQRAIAAVLIGAGALTCLPYFIPATPGLLRHIHFALLQNTSITGLQGGWFAQTTFYIRQAALLFGRASWMAVAIVAAAVVLCKRERFTMFCLMVVAIVAYIIPTIPVVKTVMFGACFYSASLICLMGALSVLARNFPRSTAIVTASLVALQLAAHRDDQPAVYPPLLKAYRTISLRVYQGIENQSPHGTVRLYIGFPWPLGQGVLDLKSMQDRRPYQIKDLPDPLSGYFKENLQPYIDDLDRSDFVVIPSSELVSHFSQRLPAERFLDATLQHVRSDGRFELLDKIDTDWGPAFLFKNHAPST